MTTSPELIAIGSSAIASMFVIAMVNRRKITQISDWNWGPDAAEDGGIEETLDNVDDKVDCIDEKIDDERRERRRNHEDVLHEVYMNRLYQHDTVEAIAEVMSEEDDLSDVDIDPEDIEPNWADIDTAALRRKKFDNDYKTR